MAKSTVEKLYMAFNDGSWRTGFFTWNKDSHCGHTLWSLLIRAGFKFQVDDLVKIEKLCSDAGRDRPWWYGPSEGHYALAVKCGNLSFAYAYEMLKGRKPFIGSGLDYPDDPYVSGGTTAKHQGRVVEGCEFIWEGETVKVTTFRDDENYLIACAYHPRKKDDYSNKVKRRFRITHDMWADQKQRLKRLENKIKELEAKGVFIDFKKDFGYVVRVKRKKKATYYDTSGEVKPGKKLESYKPWKRFDKAVEAAAKLSDK